MTMRTVTTALAMIFLNVSGAVTAHGGGTDASGCHNDRKNGGRHCHNGHATPARPPRAFAGNDIYFPNCTAARAAGAAPVRAGQPGYARHLDRDGDGVGCEK